MNFFSVTDHSGAKHNYLVIPLSEMEYTDVLGQCETCIPSIGISSLMQNGHPYVVAEFGTGGWKTAVPLDATCEGKRLGDLLNVQDVITVVLTKNVSDAVFASKGKVDFNAHLEDVLVFSFTCSKEMAENYSLYCSYQKLYPAKP
jgi:hypothetical protein